MREDLSTQEFPSLVGKTFNVTPKGVETSSFSLFDALRDIRPPYRITFRRYKAVRSAC